MRAARVRPHSIDAIAKYVGGDLKRQDKQRVSGRREICANQSSSTAGGKPPHFFAPYGVRDCARYSVDV